MSWFEGWRGSSTRGYDWDGLEAAWVEHVERVVAHVARDHSEERFYALVLHGAYAEEGGIIGPPMVAMNSLERRTAHELPPRSGGWTLDDDRWNPSAWGDRVDLRAPGGDALAHSYDRLTDFASKGSTSRWRAIAARHEQLLVAVAAKLVIAARWRAGAFARLTRYFARTSPSRSGRSPG